MNPTRFRIGLTGGVGSGKSTIAGMLMRRGAGVVDADAIAHEITQPGGAAIGAIRAAFGDAAIAGDGSLDRAWMRTRAFGDPTARRTLETILHPLIRRVADRRSEELTAAGVPYVLFVIPLLVESGDARARFGRILVVDCPEATQIARVSRRPGVDPRTAQAILAAQATRGERLAVADDVIFNDAPLADIEERVDRLHRRYAALAAASSRAGM